MPVRRSVVPQFLLLALPLALGAAQDPARRNQVIQTYVANRDTVTFEKGVVEYRIWPAPDGKIDDVNSRKPQ